MKSGQPGNHIHANSRKEKLSRLYLYIIVHARAHTHAQVTIVKEKEEISWKGTWEELAPGKGKGKLGNSISTKTYLKN